MNKAKVGIIIRFEYDDMEYEREIESIHVYKGYSWWGDLGFGVNVMFAVHGDLDENGYPIMQGLVVQYDGPDASLHGYITDGVTWENKIVNRQIVN